MPANTQGKRTDIATRLIHASPEALYDASMDPAALVRWLPPAGMKGRIHRFDGKVGGGFTMTLTYDPPEPDNPGKSSQHADVVEARFRELVPGRRIVQVVRFASDDPAFAGDMVVDWTFDRVRDGTKVTITCENVPSGIREEDHRAGLNASLDNLAAYAGARRSAVPR